MSDANQRHHQGRERPLHTILGAGKVTEVLLWKNKKLSAAILAGFTGVWLMFEVYEYHFVALLCHVLILTMLLLFFWNKLAALTNWDPPNIQEFEMSESTLRDVFEKMKWLLLKFFEISYGDDFKLFLITIATLWLISLIGSLASSLNLIFIGFVSLQILPVLYEKYEEDVDRLAAQAAPFFKNCYHNLILSKIPRGTIKRNY